MFKKVQNYQMISIQSVSADGVNYIKAREINTQNYFTLKRIKIINQTEKSLNVQSESKNYQILCDKLLQQANVLNILNHQSVPRFHKILKTKQNVYLVYDYHPSNNLVTYFQKARPTFSEKIKLAKKISQIVRYIHSKGIILKQIKPESILINKKGFICLTGFQQSAILQRLQQQDKALKIKDKNCFLTNNNNKFLFKQDIFSLGMMFKQLFKFTYIPSVYLAQKSSAFRDIAKIVQNMVSENLQSIPPIQSVAQLFDKSVGRLNSTQDTQCPSWTTFSTSQAPSSPTFTNYSGPIANYAKKQDSKFMIRQLNCNSSEKGQIRQNKLKKSSSSLLHSFSQRRLAIPKQQKSGKGQQGKWMKNILNQRNSIIFLLQMSKFSLQFNQLQLSKHLMKTALSLNKSLKVLINSVKPKQEKQKNILNSFMNQTISLQRLSSQNNISLGSKLKKLKSLNSSQVSFPDHIQKIHKKQQGKILGKLIIQLWQHIFQQFEKNQVAFQQESYIKILKKYYYLSSKIKYGTFQDFFALKFLSGQRQLWKYQYFLSFQKRYKSNQEIIKQIRRRIQKWKGNPQNN